jgi:hypothetical protein
MKKFIVSILLILSISQAALAAPQFTGKNTISSVALGWAADTMSVSLLNTPIINPAGCTVTGGGYATLPTDSGRNLYHNFIRDAYFRKTAIRLLISDNSCAFSKPRIIGVLLD